MRDLTGDNFESFVAGSGIRLVLFGARDCPPAYEQRREFEQFDEQCAQLAAIDALVHDGPRCKLGIRRLPTTVVFHNGAVVQVLAGYQPASRIETIMRGRTDRVVAGAAH